jgi:polyhydroxybutyrate depolymerase
MSRYNVICSTLMGVSLSLVIACQSDSTPLKPADTDDTDSTPAGPPPETFGGERPAPYFVPESYDGSEEMPLLVMLHGYTGSGTVTAEWWNMVEAAEEAGVMLIVPEGKVDPYGAPFWNATDFCCDFFGSEVDDVAYLSGLIEEAIGWFAIDEAKIYMMGHSNGGFMSHRMACERSDLLAGIANVAGATWFDAADCGEPEPVSVLQVHGTWDTVIYYEGLESRPAGIPPQDPDFCLSEECGNELTTCLEDRSCEAMVACYDTCAPNDNACFETCFYAGTAVAQFLWMETFVCGLGSGCYSVDPTPGYASAAEGAARWAAINGCAASPADGETTDLLYEIDGAETTSTAYGACPAGLAAELWTMAYGSHSPGFNDNWGPAVLEWLLLQEKAMD